MSRTRLKTETLIGPLQGQDLDAHYLGYFDRFNRQLFFEAHEVLEELWLAERGGPKDHFYRSLIQLAGAFVHLQHGRRAPAVALLKRAQANLVSYGPTFDRLDISRVSQMIDGWLLKLGSDAASPVPVSPDNAPKLFLLAAGEGEGGRLAD